MLQETNEVCILMSFIVGTVYYWWTIKSRLQQRKLYQFTLQNYIPSSNTHLLTLYNTDFFSLAWNWNGNLLCLHFFCHQEIIWDLEVVQPPLEKFLGKVFLISPVIISRVRRLSWGAGVSECQKTWWGQANVMGIMCPSPTLCSTGQFKPPPNTTI